MIQKGNGWHESKGEKVKSEPAGYMIYLPATQKKLFLPGSGLSCLTAGKRSSGPVGEEMAMNMNGMNPANTQDFFVY